MSAKDEETSEDDFLPVYSHDLGHDIVKKFMIPALKDAVEYRRVTGDFSSAFLAAAAGGIGPFFLQGGRMYLITNGRFSEEDARAIEAGTSPEKVFEDNILEKIQSMEDIVSEFEREHLRALVWLLKTNRLEIRVSLLKGANGAILPASTPTGVQHSKVGIISKASGKEIAFLGGINESMRAYCGNAELLTAWYSWKKEDLEKISICKNIFDILWNNQSPKSYVMKFPEACKKELIARYKSDFMPNPISKPDPVVLTDSDKWKHQDRAVDVFLSKEKGILEMATGTGKTRTALRIAKQLLEKGDIKGIVIAAMGNDLMDQWYERELKGFFGPNEPLRFRYYGPHKELGVFAQVRGVKTTAMVTSYENLPEVIAQNNDNMLENFLLICDEIHNIGSEGNVASLTGKLSVFRWKLGLSATPEREYDPIGTKFLEDEVGPVIFRFSLKEGIRKGILCEFDYVPLEYSLSQEDKSRLRRIYSWYNASLKKKIPVTEKELYIELAKVRKLSKNKLPIFKKYLDTHQELVRRTVVFVETKEYGRLVQDIIHHASMDYHTYYGEDESENLSKFADGELNCLITCKRISEGIDIKTVRNIVLFSCSRPKLETIQRIGRCLRVDPLDPGKRATVVDFVLKDDLKAGKGKRDRKVDKERYDWLTDLAKTRRESSEGNG